MKHLALSYSTRRRVKEEEYENPIISHHFPNPKDPKAL